MTPYLKDIYAAIPDVVEREKYIFTDLLKTMRISNTRTSLDHKDSPHFSIAWMTDNPNAYTEYRLLLDMMEQMYTQLHRVFKICAPNHLRSQKVIVYVGDIGIDGSANNLILVNSNCDPYIPLRMYTMSALKHNSTHMIGLNITRDRYIYDVIASFLIAHTFPEKVAPTFRVVLENSHLAIDSAHNTEFSMSYNRHIIGYLPEDAFHMMNFVTKSYGKNAIACVIHQLKAHSDVLFLETLSLVLKQDVQSLMCEYICDACKVFADVVFTQVNLNQLRLSPCRRIECFGFHAIDLQHLSPATGINYTISWTCTPHQDLWRVIIFNPNPVIISSGYESYQLNAAYNQFIVFTPCYRKLAEDPEPSYSLTVV